MSMRMPTDGGLQWFTSTCGRMTITIVDGSIPIMWILHNAFHAESVALDVLAKVCNIIPTIALLKGPY